MSPHSNTSTQDDGATLLELIVVLAVAAAVAVLALPRMGAGIHKAGFRDAVLTLAADIQDVRSAAIRASAVQYFAIEPTRGLYWSSVTPRRCSLPPGASIAISGPGIVPASDGSMQLGFEPDGSAQGAVITLAVGASQAAINVDWLTGSSHVDWHR
jgi:Tfp pilus assembly protein FimT